MARPFLSMTFFFSLLLATLIRTKADVPRVSPAELQQLMAKGEAIALDVRGTVPFKYGHIAQAVSIPLGLLDRRSNELPQDKLIVAYCACKAEETSLEAALLLAQKHGFERVAVLQGGLQAWTAAKLPTEAERTVHFEAEPPAPAAGRLAPPSAVKCDRNQLTSYAGRVTAYARSEGRTTLTIATDDGTVETVIVAHPGSDDPSTAFLLEGAAFGQDGWKRIEQSRGVLHPSMRAIAWVCTGGETIIDWRPAAQ